jgi:hypothetical protein
LPRKTDNRVKITLKISKKLLLQVVLFTMIAAAAVLFDFYVEKHPEALPLDELQDENKKTSDEFGTIHLISQVNNFNAKTPLQKAPTRKLFDEAHDKFLQQCHQLQNLQALKAKIIIPKKQLFVSLHFLNHSHLYSLHPDDEPLIA